MDEDLLGYLLGALEPHEMRRVASLLAQDPEARTRLEELQSAIAPLEESNELIESPPADLVAKTLAGLPAPYAGDETTVGDWQQPTESALQPMQSELSLVGGDAWRRLDWVGGIAAAAVILGLLLPSLSEGRFEARKAACQARLRELGIAITRFVNRDHQRRMPAVAESGPEAFAGVYAIRLNEAGLLSDATVRWCPSQPTPSIDSVTVTQLGKINSVADLHSAPPDVLRHTQQYVGGNYAYNLGVFDQQRLRPPRFESRSSFAVMSDAPPAGFHDREDLRRLTSHRGEGINVLFEDGRVEFVPLSALDAMPDHPLLNHRGQAEAGVHVDDASLAPSHRAPFINAVQR